MAKKKNKKQPPKPAPSKLTPEGTLAKQRLDLARKIVRNAVQTEKSVPAKYRRYSETSDLDEVRANRRIAATLSVMDAAKSLAQPLCPDVQDFYSFEEEWLEQNLDGFLGYDMPEQHTWTQLAAALWMLDRLRDEHRTLEACQLFPRDHRLFDELDFPDIWDISHEIDPIMGMLWTIRHRNDDCTGLPKPKSKGQAAPLPRPYLDRYTAGNLHRQDVPSRNRFTKILSLIPQAEIDRAVRLYEDTFWDLVRRYFAGRETLVKEELDLESRRKKYLDKATSLIAEMKQSAPMFLEAQQPKMPLLVSADPFQMQYGKSIEITKQKSSQLMRARELDSIQSQLDEDQYQLDEQIDFYRHAFGEMLMASPHHRAELHSREIAEIWSDFQIEDPYALCFAFLYLLDTGSDLPWVFGISTQLMTLCSSVLPWRYYEFDLESDDYWLHYNDEVQDMVYPSSKPLPKRIKVPVLENWYAMDYTDKTIPDDEYQESCNLAQILYEITGGIMPRNLTRYAGALEELDRYGLSGKKALHPLMYCMTFLGETWNHTPMIQFRRISSLKSRRQTLSRRLPPQRNCNSRFDSCRRKIASCGQPLMMPVVRQRS